MRALKLKVIVSDNNQITIQLPEDFPKGEAEIIVLHQEEPTPSAQEKIKALHAWIASLPPAAPVPMEALDRGELYR
jgi:hypothetical protein